LHRSEYFENDFSVSVSLTEIGLRCGKEWLSAYKSFNISESGQDETKVTIEDQ